MTNKTVVVKYAEGDEQRFRAATAAGLLPAVQQARGAGLLTDAEGVGLTAEYGDLEDGATYRFAEAAPETLLESTLHRFTSASDFLNNYKPHRLELLPCASSQTMGVKSEGPSVVAPWDTFDKECRALLLVLRDGGPVNLAVPAPTSAAVGNEENLHLELFTHILRPLQQALSRSDGFFEAARATQGVTEGLWTNKSARSDFVLQSRIGKKLLVAIEVKTSAVICVPQGSNLPAIYAAADSDSKIVKCVAQLFSYLDVVPFGVLVTDQQLFCMLRKGTDLLCSRSIPLAGYVHCPAKRGPGRPTSADLLAATSAAEAAQEQFKAVREHSADSLTAVAALYCMAKVSQQWWAQRPPQQPTGGAGQGNSGDSGADTTGARPRRSFLRLMLAGFGIHALEGAQHPAAAAAPKPVLRLPCDAERECTSSQLFPGRSFDPRVPDGVPPSLGNSCLGVVLEGAVGGRAAAVKLVDLWQGPEGKEAVLREVRTYQLLQPLQGVYVPHLLGYGFCDGWQYFLATSLEGPTLTSEEGWALGEEATCAAAFAALDAVHRCGVLHGDIALRNFVLAAQPAGVGGSAAGGGGDWGGVSQTSTTAQQPQLQPRVMLLDFGHSQLVAEAAKAWGEEPAALIQRERRTLQDLLGWEPSSPLPVPLPPVDTDAGSGAKAAAASGGAGGDTGGQAQHPQLGMPETDTDMALPGGSAAASRPGPPAAQGSAGPRSAFPPPPPRPPSRPSGWRQQLRFFRPQMSHMPRPLAWNGLNVGRSASRLSLRRIS
ncbi:hypothetical protein TSOC_014152 [Tetrabaena socialis]|uniref:Protein kinase domain-containing protein n=1 Tax=Tetrabaena socialis TaxID=47790 RepID=A0A2J7ZIE8_9CHLO|nr:hypothetical protein TSOC_014152 [Tetrabaena socialis]|eukprot:PNH00045.1 hypothetical protein TSOC_014152 [Tetrabaena socialis]